MKIDKSRLGNIEYGNKIAERLKLKYKNLKVKDVEYDYFLEGFYFVLENNEKIPVDIYEI